MIATNKNADCRVEQFKRLKKAIDALLLAGDLDEVEAGELLKKMGAQPDDAIKGDQVG